MAIDKRGIEPSLNSIQYKVLALVRKSSVPLQCKDTARELNLTTQTVTGALGHLGEGLGSRGLLRASGVGRSVLWVPARGVKQRPIEGWQNLVDVWKATPLNATESDSIEN